MKRTDAGRLQRADDDILRPEIGRIVRCLHARFELGIADAQRQAICLDGGKMRPARHAGHLMSGKRQSHRKMAPDGARAEDAYPHERKFLSEGWGLLRQFP
jgi:hypothetical protein